MLVEYVRASINGWDKNKFIVEKTSIIEIPKCVR